MVNARLTIKQMQEVFQNSPIFELNTRRIALRRQLRKNPEDPTIAAYASLAGNVLWLADGGEHMLHGDVHPHPGQHLPHLHLPAVRGGGGCIHHALPCLCQGVICLHLSFSPLPPT